MRRVRHPTEAGVLNLLAQPHALAKGLDPQADLRARATVQLLLAHPLRAATLPGNLVADVVHSRLQPVEDLVFARLRRQPPLRRTSTERRQRRGRWRRRRSVASSLALSSPRLTEHEGMFVAAHD